MSAQHTPGPWFVSAADMLLGEDDIISIGILAGSDDEDTGTTVSSVCAFGLASEQDGAATVYTPTAPDAEALATAQANARLIAAAPELLALLQRFERFAAGTGFAYPLGSLQELQMLIAKATGSAA